ncbi:hypothetical protein PR202_gb26601 [Eleusine coracana subsp. coracana]|uniref:SIAH-type domain-containing protein n=1 Tax=Eleusine coracana subsp. coracana TaxID=191504 RepID=A0AAV5FSA3_ELECO|nr:hypothetical protein QOZ80_1BG0056550 [Eleusine coracana subsp. coracana]GJN37627.1 hypothetical protein PR202_gb26601 [Eleusine coracana subsp. coracana]
MAELQTKRGSQLENGDEGHSGKKARARGLSMNNGVVKQEHQEAEVGEEEDQEEGEVRQGSSDPGVALVATEAMGEPQISLRLGITLFHCRACLRPLKPPTFKCDADHVVCFACRTVHGQGCPAGAAYVACPEVDAFVRNAKQPCAFEEFGCNSVVVYHSAADHHRACPWAPCSCPSPGCDFLSSPARLLDHFAAAHAWPVAEVSYGRPHALAVPPPGARHALVGEEDRRVFLVSASAVGAAAVAVSLVCVRANGGAAEGVPQYRCKLWAEVASNKDNMTMMMSTVASSNLAGGLPAAGEQGMFLAVPVDILHDVSGEAPLLMVRIDRISALAAAKAGTPPARSTRRLQ